MKDDNHPGPAFVLEGVSKVYPSTVAISRVSLEIGRGERVAVVGPSGSGKTTFLHLLGGVVKPDEGRVFIDGRPLSALRRRKELASLVGLIHQQFDLVPHLSVVHNVLAGRLGYWNLLRSLLSLISPRELPLALEALRRVGLPDKLYERTSKLSGGEQQRVAIARLLVQSPRAILADEPVASLDPARAEDLMQLLLDIVQESQRTLVASLHSVEITRRYFSRAIGLRNGQLQFDIPVEVLTEQMLEELYDLGDKKGHLETELSTAP